MRKGAEQCRKRFIRVALVFLNLCDDDYKLLGVILLRIAYKKPRGISRGRYNVKRSQDVLKTILIEDSDKYFKAHLRYVVYLSCNRLTNTPQNEPRKLRTYS